MLTRRLTGTLGAAAALTLALGSPALAEPVDLDPWGTDVPVANVVWEIANWGGDYGYSTTEAAVFAEDVDPADPWAVDPVVGDGLDGMFTVVVDGVVYGSSACTTPAGEGEPECDYTVDISAAGDDTVVTAPTETMAGLEVAVQQRFYAVGDLSRTLVSFRNPTAAAVTATVEIVSDYGSDWDTTLEGDSSGDEDVSPADRWFVTGDDEGGDPVVTTAWAGPAATLAPTDAFLGAVRQEEGESLVSYELTVAPGATVHLAYFVGVRGWEPIEVAPDDGLEATVPVAAGYAAAADASVAAAAEFATFGGRLTAGLAAGTQVLNWGTVGGAAPATPVVVAPAFTG